SVSQSTVVAPRAADATTLRQSCHFEIGADVRKGLVAVAHSCGTGLLEAFVAAVPAFLQRHTGIETHRVRASLAGDGYGDHAFTVDVDGSGDPPFAELLGRVRDSAQGDTWPEPSAEAGLRIDDRLLVSVALRAGDQPGGTCPEDASVHLQ